MECNALCHRAVPHKLGHPRRRLSSVCGWADCRGPATGSAWELDLKRQRGVVVMLGFLYAFVASSFRIYHPLYMAYPLFGAVALWVSTRRRAGAPGSAARGGTSRLADGAT